MRKEPSQLIALLQRLGLATAKQVRAMRGRVRRLTRDLPRFESVWVDALAQARILTPWQAAEINAGRGESLRIGPYVLCRALPSPDYVATYRARHIESGQVVRLAVVKKAGHRADEILGRLQALAAASQRLRSENLAPVTEVQLDGERIWAALPSIEGRSAAEWMVHHGRFPPEVVWQIARAMLAGLGELEKAGLCHGDISAWGLTLTDAGGVVLLQPGVRGILRPEEGHAHADLRPEAYDYLAPERITGGTRPNTASDVYACGCLWWQLLCGRPPLSGGSSLAKLRAAQAAKVFDVRRLAPEVPAPLAAAISACLSPQPSRRPESIVRLSAMLGSPTRGGKTALARCLVQSGRRRIHWAVPDQSIRGARHAGLRLVAVAGCLVAAAAILGSIWHARTPIPAGHTGRQEAALQGRPEDSPARKGGVLLSGEKIARPRPSGRGYSDISSASISSASISSASSVPADNAVMPAGYEADPPDLVLASGGPLVVEKLELRAGQCVRGRPGERPLVMVPRTGLVVGQERVRFENIDFVYDHPPRPQDAATLPVAIVHLCVSRAEFRGCSFRSTGTTPTPPAAIRWTHPADPGDSALSLPSGRVQLSDCVLRGVAAGVDCRTVGALAVELTNTLQIGGGPLVRLDHCPRLDEPVFLALSQVTLRGTAGLLQCRCQGEEYPPGEISIEASGSAFVPSPGAALLWLTGPKLPEQLLRNIRWTGQGSLVSPRAVIAAWCRPDGESQTLDDDAVSIAGLVRSEVGFAGQPASAPSASRIIRWQVPLRSSDPPGIDPDALPERGAGGLDKPRR